MVYSREECIKALKTAEKRLGKSPTMDDYKDIEGDIPSIDTILRKFDTWNKAKNEAGLETFKQNNKIEEKPDALDLPDGKDWRELSSYQRYYYRNRESEKKRSKDRKKDLKKWFKKIKRELECERCGESHPACLDFHHKEDKEHSVNELVSEKIASRKRIKQEIDKCEVLCANCHRKHHSNSPLV